RAAPPTRAVPYAQQSHCYRDAFKSEDTKGRTEMSRKIYNRLSFMAVSSPDESALPGKHRFQKGLTRLLYANAPQSVLRRFGLPAAGSASEARSGRGRSADRRRAAFRAKAGG